MKTTLIKEQLAFFSKGRSKTRAAWMDFSVGSRCSATNNVWGSAATSILCHSVRFWLAWTSAVACRYIIIAYLSPTLPEPGPRQCRRPLTINMKWILLVSRKLSSVSKTNTSRFTDTTPPTTTPPIMRFHTALTFIIISNHKTWKLGTDHSKLQRKHFCRPLPQQHQLTTYIQGERVRERERERRKHTLLMCKQENGDRKIWQRKI